MKTARREGSARYRPNQAADLQRVDKRLSALEEAVRAATTNVVHSLAQQHRIALDVVASRMEASLWLQGTLELEFPLPPTGGWAASPDLLAELVRQMYELEPKVVVEAGTGVSTIVIASVLRRLGGHLWSLEHNPEWIKRADAQIAAHHLQGTSTIVQAPLATFNIAGSAWEWYSYEDSALPETIDMLFVDGPPGTTGAMARYPAMPLLVDRLSPGAIILVDDTLRDEDGAVVDIWLAEYPELEGRELPLEKGAWLLRWDLGG